MNQEEALRSRQQAKPGLFIRWGLHSLTGQDEQLMYRERIPAKEYEKLAARFEGARFDPEEWARLAKEAGLGYIVITAKGYDGFSLFSTQMDSFNSCEAAPLGRDVVGELAQVCRREGIGLGIHYAHARDWRHPMAQSFEPAEEGRLVNCGNFWDYPMEHRKNLQAYLDEYALPQLNELLTRYGNLFTVRFDAPSLLRPDQADGIRDFIRERQPDCLISGMLCAEENTECAAPQEAGGMNLRWEDIVRSLTGAAGKGQGLLISVYPQGDGSFSEGDRRALLKTGAWLRENGEAVYGASASPFYYEPSWGKITQKENCLYLIVTDPAARAVTLTGLQSRVRACSALAGGKAMRFEQTHEDSEDVHSLTVSLTGLQGSFRVVRVETADGIKVSRRLGPDGEGRIALPMSHAERQEGHARWTLHADRPGRFLLSVGLMGNAKGEIRLELDGSVYALECGNRQSVTVDTVFLTCGRHVLEAWTDNDAAITGCMLTPI